MFLSTRAAFVIVFVAGVQPSPEVHRLPEASPAPARRLARHVAVENKAGSDLTYS